MKLHETNTEKADLYQYADDITIIIGCDTKVELVEIAERTLDHFVPLAKLIELQINESAIIYKFICTPHRKPRSKYQRRRPLESQKLRLWGKHVATTTINQQTTQQNQNNQETKDRLGTCGCLGILPW